MSKTSLKLKNVNEGDWVTLGVRISPVEVFDYEGTIINITDTHVTIETEDSAHGDDELREYDFKIKDIQYVN